MAPPEPREHRTPRGFSFVAVALLGLAFAFTPWADQLDNRILDAQWRTLRKFDIRPAPPEIVIVGIDERTAQAIAAPPGMWHEALGMALVRLASARPRAIALEIGLPERSFDDVRPGLDRALLVGLAAARENGPLVASLTIDARTRAARPIHLPYLALLGEERLGLGLVARDGDGVTRRYALRVPTEDGAFPTLVGRLCRALSRDCTEGLLHFALGEPFAYVPLQRLLEIRDTERLARLFRDRIVLLGDTSRFGGRIPVPVNVAAWEDAVGDMPSAVVHAQSLRTALQDAAPREASRPLVAVVLSLAALLALMKRPLHALIVGVIAAMSFFAGATLLLRTGLFMPLAGALGTLAIAFLWVSARSFGSEFEFRRRR
ncbi:MAG TPA: CHASE2 domain-containing protein [Usitatibacter sp.]|nr:CHASE2 domain-containing protein [Usitatibacter sp.]